MIKYPADSIVEGLLNKIAGRSDEGMRKYSVPLTRKDLYTDFWRLNAIEELIDLLLYLERSMKTRQEAEDFAASMHHQVLSFEGAEMLLDFIYGPK